MMFNVCTGFNSTRRGWTFSLRWCCMWSCSDLQCQVILGWLVERACVVFQNAPRAHTWFDVFSASNYEYSITVFFKENVRYAVWTCRDLISLILVTRFGSLKQFKKPCIRASFCSKPTVLIWNKFQKCQAQIRAWVEMSSGFLKNTL